MATTTVDQLSNELLKVLDSLPSNERYLLGIAGVPGAGKTWLSHRLVESINKQSNAPVAIALSMDGFHLTKEQLRAMPDPELAFRRRGSVWTFDAQDPVPNGITIQPSHRLLIVEGLYIALDESPWSEAPFDAIWFTQLSNWQIAYDRLVKRHQEAGLAHNEEQAQQRIDQNDHLNAQYLLASHRKETRIIELICD
ncbi:P-loop containing nucleoside triphosphate hydrolase protein [Syncephalis fuscata]|nr:P-loop containing nucleoside triphosphate hydrolase protein [Syncephalis fuscata]